MCRTLGFQDGFVAAGGEEVSEVQASAVWSECQRNSALPLFPSLLQSCLFIHAFSLFLWGALTLVLDPMAQGCLSVLCFFHTGELQGELLSNNIIIKKKKKKSSQALCSTFIGWETWRRSNCLVPSWIWIWTTYLSCFPDIPLLFPLSCWLHGRKETSPANKHKISFFQQESHLIPGYSVQRISALVTPGIKLPGSTLWTFQVSLVWIQTSWILCCLQSHPAFTASNATSFALDLWLALCHYFLGFFPLFFFTMAANLACGCQKSLGLARRQSKSLLLT